MRFALRKKDKIASVYSDPYLNDHIIQSLNKYFEIHNDSEIEKLMSLSKELDCQISIKQLHGFDDKGRFAEISDKYHSLFKVYDKNYLIYYMPNNTVTETFLF